MKSYSDFVINFNHLLTEFDIICTHILNMVYIAIISGLWYTTSYPYSGMHCNNILALLKTAIISWIWYTLKSYPKFQIQIVQGFKNKCDWLLVIDESHVDSLL